MHFFGHLAPLVLSPYKQHTFRCAHATFELVPNSTKSNGHSLLPGCVMACLPCQDHRSTCSGAGDDDRCRNRLTMVCLLSLHPRPRPWRNIMVVHRSYKGLRSRKNSLEGGPHHKICDGVQSQGTKNCSQRFHLYVAAAAVGS